MKQVLFLFLSITCLGISNFTQTSYFNKLYNMPNINLATCSIEVDSIYIVVGQQLTSVNKRLTLYKLNKKGDTLQTTYYNVDTLRFFAQKIIRVRDNIYIYMAPIHKQI